MILNIENQQKSNPVDTDFTGFFVLWRLTLPVFAACLSFPIKNDIYNRIEIINANFFVKSKFSRTYFCRLSISEIEECQ